MQLKHINLSIEAGISWIKFNRPNKLNALNPDVISELELAIIESEKNDSVKVIVLKGQEKAFIAGADIEHMAKGGIGLAYDISQHTLKVQERLVTLSKPTIAAVSGYALGGGCEMALCCDFRIAADNAKFGLPEIKLGIIPGGGGTQRLPRLVGMGPATELILLGKIISAERAEEIGLVNKVVPLASLENEVESLASELMKRPTWAVTAAKRAIQASLNVPLEHGLRFEQSLFCMLFGTEDQKEGMNAF